MVEVLGDRQREGRKDRRKEGVRGFWGGGVLTLQFEDWFRLGGDPSVHSAVSVLQDCLLSSYSFSYVEKKSLERQRNRTGGPPTLTRRAATAAVHGAHSQCTCTDATTSDVVVRKSGVDSF